MIEVVRQSVPDNSNLLLSVVLNDWTFHTDNLDDFMVGFRFQNPLINLYKMFNDKAQFYLNR